MNTKKILKLISVTLLIISILGIIKIFLFFIASLSVFAMSGNPFVNFGIYASFLLILKIFINILILYSSIYLLKLKNKGRITLNYGLTIFLLSEAIKSIQILISNSSDLSVNNIGINLFIMILIVVGIILYVNKEKTRQILN